MNLAQRIEILQALRPYLLQWKTSEEVPVSIRDFQLQMENFLETGFDPDSSAHHFQQVVRKALAANPWFTPEFMALALEGIANWLEADVLEKFAAQYAVNDRPTGGEKTIGLVMAGNLPLVGFHDWLCVFITGHRSLVKCSSKDQVLFPHLMEWCEKQFPEMVGETTIQEQIKGADAYIATGSNNTARYFDYYFGKYPHIIRQNRSSAALLTGKETPEELKGLANDIHFHFGRGCRNVTQLWVPEGYAFETLLDTFVDFDYFFDHPKFRSNYDYQLAIQILNRQYYMTRKSVLLLESDKLFAPLGVVHYQYYTDPNAVIQQLKEDQNLQCLVAGTGQFSTEASFTIPFGKAQKPGITDYADGVDTMAFLQNL